MKFYFVGAEFRTRVARFVKRRLMSYWKKPHNDAQRCTPGTELFLDSGAYSALTQKREIDIEAYARYINETAGTWDHVASLDFIPPPEVHPDFAAEKSYRNLRRLEALGCRGLIPVFHCGESLRYLERYAAEHEYIGLGRGVARGPALKSALDWCWSHLTDADGRPRVKVHGFGMSSYWLVARYPWYSLDSQSWLDESWMAHSVNAFIDGKPAVKVRLKEGESLPQEVEARFGVTTEEARNDVEVRLMLNAAFYSELEHHSPDRFEHRLPCTVVQGYRRRLQRRDFARTMARRVR